MSFLWKHLNELDTTLKLPDIGPSKQLLRSMVPGF
jgi:hypothetical protein